LTPAGNATERHLCLAYARKAAEKIAGEKRLREFWGEKLGTASETLETPEGLSLLNLIRAKTMKRGGAGYVQPNQGSFPGLEETNAFILAAGGIPTLAWLDGMSEGERDIEALVDAAMRSGVAAINIIPDRNYKPGVQDEKLAHLYEVAELAQQKHLPIVVGTEMNSPGQKFVDDFGSRELAPLAETFLKGAYIVYAHSVLQRQCGLGYSSAWASRVLGDRAGRNEFFEQVGRSLTPEREPVLSGCDAQTSAEEIRKKAAG
jgi:hypothetical protein